MNTVLKPNSATYTGEQKFSCINGGVSAHIATSKDSLVLPVTADGVRVWTLSPSTAACEYSPWENFNTWDKVFTTSAGICSLIYTSKKKKKLETIPIFFFADGNLQHNR